MKETRHMTRLQENEVPMFTNTRSGVQFCPSDDVWSYRDGVKTIRLPFPCLQAPSAIVQNFKRVLTWYAEHESPCHVINLFSRFKHFLSATQLNTQTIGSIPLMNYRANLRQDDRWYLGALSGLFKRWHAMGLPGISDDAVKYLKAIRIAGNKKGEAVLTMDPEQGRFSDLEFEGVLSSAHTGFECRIINQAEYALFLLFMTIGARPVQYASMKVCDVSLICSDQSVTYLIHVPRAKRREQDARSSFAKRSLVPEIGAIIKAQADATRQQFEGLLQDPAQAPLFPAVERRKAEPPGFEYHRTSTSLSQWFKNITDKLLVRSERTGEMVHMNPTRFRRTLACRAADEGHGARIIAELLDHKDTQNAGVYTEATPGMMDRIDRAVAFRLAPLAQAFVGTIIRDESEASRTGDSSSRISDPGTAQSPVGNCGQFGFCGLLAPVACYTCPSFEPWLDGPHEKVLDWLIAERERLLSTTDKRIASINDRAILAVADVVEKCNEIKKGTNDE